MPPSPLALWQLYRAVAKWIKEIQVVNWKTSVAGLIMLIPIIARFAGHPIDPKDAETIIAVAALWGFTQAKDKNVTGGTKNVDGTPNTDITTGGKPNSE